MSLPGLAHFFLHHNFLLVEAPYNGALPVARHLYQEQYGLEITADEFEALVTKFHHSFPHLIDLTSHINWLDVAGIHYLAARLGGHEGTTRYKPVPEAQSLSDHVSTGPVGVEAAMLWDGSQAVDSAFYTDVAAYIKVLSEPTARRQLDQKAAQAETKAKPFYPVCTNAGHTQKLAQVVVSMASLSQDAIRTKLPRVRAVPAAIAKCMATRTHHVPFRASHTDLSMGDCSYLDACHKRETCRYVHYITVDPPVAAPAPAQPPLPDYDATQMLRVHRVLEAQWVKCDIRHIPLRIFGKFAAIIADPAWNIHMNVPYDTVSDEEMGQLAIPQLQDEGVMMIWLTARTLERARGALRAWGYRVDDEIIWIKLNQLKRTIVTGRTGHWLNHSKEHLVVGVKGSPAWLRQGVDLDYIVGNSREALRKPDEVYDVVERMVGRHARKLELFGRQHNTRAGWMTLGAQVNGTHVVEPEVAARLSQYSALAAKPRGLDVSEFERKRRD